MRQRDTNPPYGGTLSRREPGPTAPWFTFLAIRDAVSKLSLQRIYMNFTYASFFSNSRIFTNFEPGCSEFSNYMIYWKQRRVKFVLTNGLRCRRAQVSRSVTWLADVTNEVYVGVGCRRRWKSAPNSLLNWQPEQPVYQRLGVWISTWQQRCSERRSGIVVKNVFYVCFLNFFNK